MKTTLPQHKVTLAIDPGYDRLGWAVGSIAKRNITQIAYGCIQTDKKLALLQRYTQIIEELSNIIKKHNPSELAIEDLFFSKNTKTAMKVSETRGIIIGSCLQKGIRVFEYKPNQIKLAVTGSGRANKKAVDKMVRLQLHIQPNKIIDDTIDALATLITHANWGIVNPNI